MSDWCKLGLGMATDVGRLLGTIEANEPGWNADGEDSDPEEKGNMYLPFEIFGLSESCPKLLMDLEDGRVSVTFVLFFLVGNTKEIASVCSGEESDITEELLLFPVEDD